MPPRQEVTPDGKYISKIEPLTGSGVFARLCGATKKWGLYISEQMGYPLEEFIKAAPYLNEEQFNQIIIERYGMILFDSQEEMNKYYDMTVGDDGPMPLNNYSGPARVYALTCDPNGQLLNENT